MSKNYKEKLEGHFSDSYEQLMKKIVDWIKNFRNVVDVDDITISHYQPMSDKEFSEVMNDSSYEKQKKFEHLVTSLYFAEHTQGFCTIHFKDEMIYDVKEEKVWLDRLGLQAHFRELGLDWYTANFRNLSDSIPELKEYRCITKFVEVMGELKTDGSREYDKVGYNFRVKDKQLQIKRKDGRVIFNESGFSDKANSIDMENIMKWEKDLYQRFTSYLSSEKKLKPKL